MIEDLKNILAKEKEYEYDDEMEELIEEWAHEFLGHCDSGPTQYELNEYYEDKKTILGLKTQVEDYTHDADLPELPQRPNGSLNGIGFIYDEDHDDRVLVAIERLKNLMYSPEDYESIVALSERKGGLKIYTRKPTMVRNVDVAMDIWAITEYVPYEGEWLEVDDHFVKCSVVNQIERGGKLPENPIDIAVRKLAPDEWPF